MNFHCVTLFPEYLRQLLQEGVIGSAISTGRLNLETINPRLFAENAHRSVDDKPFGGGDGMVMMVEPLRKSVEQARQNGARGPCFYLSPQGRKWNDSWARQIVAEHEDIILICGRYAGVDQRFVETSVDAEISIGDFVLSGGELPAAIVVETLGRLVPGVLGNANSSRSESFADGLLECPQFTRPREFDGLSVPEVLLSGDHLRIQAIRESVAVVRTSRLRPDLEVAKERLERAAKALQELSDEDLLCFGVQRSWL